MSEPGDEAPARVPAPFRSLLGPGAPYLELLSLRSDQALRPVRAALAGSGRMVADVETLLRTLYWRPQLVGAVASLLLSGPACGGLAGEVWAALDRGSWVAPQLVVIALQLDPGFEAQAFQRLEHRAPAPPPLPDPTDLERTRLSRQPGPVLPPKAAGALRGVLTTLGLRLAAAPAGAEDEGERRAGQEVALAWWARLAALGAQGELAVRRPLP